MVRVFDDRIVVESPGLLPGAISAANIQYARSKARNPLIAQNLREFAVPPNIDDGEGVRMMFGEMAAAQLYPPQYRQNTEEAVETLLLTLFNEDRPAVWTEVNDWMERNGPIANADVCRHCRSRHAESFQDAARLGRPWLAGATARAREKQRRLSQTRPSRRATGAAAGGGRGVTGRAVNWRLFLYPNPKDKGILKS